ncbi:MAG: alpha/beta hydrolase [Hyphomicrobiales bacterium]|nr:alpha/beta hydrolase [Hyphomicrobiales bacterium]
MTDWSLGQSFDFRGDAVAYDIFGDGEAVVLIHGTPFSSHVWRRIAPELARDYKVHIFDLLGYGQSAKREGQDVSLGVQNEVFASLLDHWKIENPKIIAHDFGGATALRAHFLNGYDYRKLLLIDPVAIAPWGSAFVRHVRDHEAAFAGLPESYHRAMLAAYIRGAVYRTMTDDELVPYLASWLGQPGQAGFYRQIAQMDQIYTDQVQGNYGALRCPVKLLWGHEDEWIPIMRGRELAAMLPGCELIGIDACGHLMQEDAPEAIIAAALRFFAA